MKQSITFTQSDSIQLIKAVLNKLNINLYRITEIKQDEVELYFIKKKLDMRRINQVTSLGLIVYRDFEKDGQKMRGSASTVLYCTMNEDEIKSAIQTAYYAAFFVNNPFFEIPSGESLDCVTLDSKLLRGTPEENALRMAEALYQADTQNDVFINSSEFFSVKKHVRIVNSQGIDVSYVKASISGEFISQCTTPQDVELYQDFSYNDLELSALTKLSEETLERTKSRALAAKPPKTGVYNVILSDQDVKSVLSYYIAHASSSFIYPGYSDYEIGKNIQGDITDGEALNIALKATVPFSEDGIKMIDRPLIKDGVLQTIQGNSQFAHYLKIPAIGNYTCFSVDNGDMTLDEMKKERYLHIVTFSDFTVSTVSGDIGGEIRLAYYYDGETVTPVTGGSITANIANFESHLHFSKERQVLSTFEGPKAMLLKGVTVSGS